MPKDKNKLTPKPSGPKKKDEQQLAPRPAPKKKDEETDTIRLQPMGGSALRQEQFQQSFSQFMGSRHNRSLTGFCKPESFQNTQGMGKGMQSMPGQGAQGGMGGMQGPAMKAAAVTPQGRAAMVASSLAQNKGGMQGMQNSQGMQGGMGGMQGPAMRIAAMTPQGRAAMVASSFLQQNKGQGGQFSLDIGKNNLKSTLEVFSNKGVLGQIGKLSYEQGGKKATLEGGQIAEKAAELVGKAVETAVNAVKALTGQSNENSPSKKSSPFEQGMKVPKKPTLRPDE